MKHIRDVLLVLFIALLVAGASAAGSNARATTGFKAFDTGSGIPFGVEQYFEWGAGVPAPCTPTFEFSSDGPARVLVRDDFLYGDQFRVYDFKTVLGDTSTPMEGVYSTGCFDVAEGRHEISLETIQNPWGSGGAYLKVEEGTCPTTPAPEFPTMALPLTLIVGMLGTVLFIRKIQN